MKAAILVALISTTLLSSCTAVGLQRLGEIGNPAHLPEGIPPTNIYQITSQGSNAPKVTVIVAHDCSKTFEKVPVIMKYEKSGRIIKTERGYREIETYDCNTGTLAWSSEGSTKSQLINLGETAIQGGAFAGGMRLLRPARYNSSTSLSGGNSNSAGGGANATSTGGSSTQTTDVTASPVADSSGTTAITGPVTSTSTSDSASSSTADAAGGGTIDAPTTVSNDPIIHNP